MIGLWIAAGIAIGWLAGFGIYQIDDWRNSRKPKTEAPQRVVWDKDPYSDAYGHPYHPVEALAKLLKRKPPPPGYAWEVFVEWNDDPFLKLRLLNLETQAIEAWIEQNLWMQYPAISHTWEQEYSPYGVRTKDAAFSALTDKFTFWADRMRIEYRPKKSGMEHYEVIV